MKRICCLILAALLLGGCGTRVDPYTLAETYTDGMIMEIEPLGYSRTFTQGVAQTEVDGNTYQFHRDVPLETRADFIARQRALNELLEECAGWQVSGISFRMHQEYPCRSDSQEQAVYLDPTVIGTWQQALITVQCLLGDDVTYGYAWAMANDLAARLGWVTDDAGQMDVNVFVGEPEMLNLVYPCFREEYSSKKEVLAAKALAAELFAAMEAPYAGEAEFLAAAEDYARTSGIEFTATYLRFSYQSASCPMQIAARYLTYQIDSTFTADAYRSYMDGNWMGTVSLMMEQLEAMDTMLERYREVFGYAGDEVLSVQLTDNLQSAYEGEIHDYAGFYYYQSQKIYAISISVIPHEYVHHLYGMCSEDWRQDDGWYSEALAYYLAETDQARMLGEEEELGDCIERVHRYIAYYKNETKPKWWISTNNVHSEVLSIAGYIVDTYGEELFVRLMLNPSQAEELVGRTLDQIEDDWVEFIYDYDLS